MEDKDSTQEGGKCCTKGKCCGCKALAAVALLAAGALGGYFFARHCRACPMANVPAPAVQAPAK